MEILHFEDLGGTSVISECNLGDNLVIEDLGGTSVISECNLGDNLVIEDLGDTSVVWLQSSCSTHI